MMPRPTETGRGIPRYRPRRSCAGRRQRGPGDRTDTRRARPRLPSTAGPAGPRTRATYPVKTRRRVEVTHVAWFVLIVSGMFEAVWATALGASDGFRRLGPSIVFLVALAISMGGLAYAMRTLPTGTSYAVWVGVGASLAVVYAMLTGAEPASTAKVLLLLGLIGCIVGPRLVGRCRPPATACDPPPRAPARPRPGRGGAGRPPGPRRRSRGPWPRAARCLGRRWPWRGSRPRGRAGSRTHASSPTGAGGRRRAPRPSRRSGWPTACSGGRGLRGRG